MQPTGRSNLSQATKGRLTLVNTRSDDWDTGTFTLTTDEQPSVAVLVYDPFVSDFTTDDISAEFKYNNWALVGKTETVEININRANLHVTMTFWYGDTVTGVYSSKFPPSPSIAESTVRTAPCTWKVPISISTLGSKMTIWFQILDLESSAVLSALGL